MGPELTKSHQIEVVTTLREIPQREWNALERGDFVFSDHRFLLALEDANCLGERAGWYPFYLVLREEGVLTAALLLFAKANSYGEFIFDWAWAAAAERSGLRYYPKLTSAVPFTPATGRKFLGPSWARPLLLEGARQLRMRTDASSLHFLFITEEESAQLAAHGMMIRHSFQYHWRNQGWATFADFLGALRAKRRSEIRRERETVVKSGLSVVTLTGQDLRPEHARLVYELYFSTTDKRGSPDYLTPEFFELLIARMPEHVLIVLAYDGARPVAGALSMISGKTLYGRYWGCHQDYRHLHFEVCYYQAIDWALANGIELFEAGAQGEHKFNRGFLPSLTLSAHEIEDQRLAEAVARAIRAETLQIGEMMKDYAEHDPFKRMQ